MAREILSKRNFFDFESPDSTIIQCKQRYIRTSLPCNVTVEDLKKKVRFAKLQILYYAGLDIGSE
jgi:hypothetical protein